MSVDWQQVSTDLTAEQIESTYKPVGRLILAHAQFDLLIGRLILSLIGLGQMPIAAHLVYAVDSVNKKRILDSCSSVYASGPDGVIADYEPQPKLKKRIKKVSSAFEAASKVRNTIAHGTLGRLGNRVFIGSVAATTFFKNTGGAEGWVFVDEIDSRVTEMLTSMHIARALQREFDIAHQSITANKNE